MGVYVIKMNSGEELLSEIVEETDSVVFDRPRTVRLFPPQGPGEEPRVGLAPWLIMAPDSKISVSKTSIAAMVPAEKEIASQYSQQVTGIYVP